MITLDKLVASVVESMRHHRRWGPHFPTVYDLSKITYNENCIELDLVDLETKQVVKFDLWAYRVREHGEGADYIEELDLGEVETASDNN